MKLTFPLVALAAILLSRQTPAATFNVAGGDVAGLISAINTANNNNQNDTIVLFAGGTYTLATTDSADPYYGPAGLPVIASDNGHNLTIDGGSGATIERAPGSPEFRLFVLGGDTNVVIGGVNLRGGAVTTLAGGAIAIFKGNLTLSECILENNSARFGGAVMNETIWHGPDDPKSGHLTVINCVLRKNTSQFGTIYNRADGGEGSSGASAHLTVADTTFSENGAGGIYSSKSALNSSANVTISGCTFSDNGRGSGDTGAAVDNRLGTLTLTNCTFSGNGNASMIGGSGVSHTVGPLTLKNCTFSGNSGAGAGALYVGGATASIGSTVFKTGSTGVNIHSNNSTITSLGYNVSDDDGGGSLNAGTDQINTDPKLDPAGLLDNGGPTKSIALTSASTAVDHGKSFGQATDQRGFARVFNDPSITDAIGGDGSDSGAFEATDAVQAGPTLVVTSSGGHDDGTAGAKDCTLREAVARANLIPGPNTIVFASGVTGAIILSGADPLNITDSIAIIGPGARLLAVSGNGLHRVFSVTAGASTISGLTIRDGWEVFGGSPGESRAGGGICNEAALTLNDCAFERNYVKGTDGAVGSAQSGGAGQGGAIFNGGALTLNRCSFNRTSGGNIASGGAGADNSADFGFGGSGGAAQGGAVFNAATGALTVNNCTFSGNSVAGGEGGSGRFGGNGGSGSGGAIFNLGTMTLTADTVNDNAGTGGPGGAGNAPINNGASGSGCGGLATAGGLSIVQNTISAGNAGQNGGGADVNGAFESGGYNLIGTSNGSTGFTAVGDQIGTRALPLNANLGPLQNNGGPTDTMSPLPGSPAVDKGRSFALTTDQRGESKPLDATNITNASGGDGADIGAVETDVTQTGPVFVVTTTDDRDDGSTFRDCTLREAISAANESSSADTISFQSGVTGAILLLPALGTLTIHESTTLAGPGARQLAIDGGSLRRAFYFAAGTQFLSGLTIRNGAVTVAPGFLDGGGGIYNQATLMVCDCTFSNNTVAGRDSATAGGPGGFTAGGAIFNAGMLTVERCTFSGNMVAGGQGGATTAVFARGGAGGTGDGGALSNLPNGTLTINNCTLFNNSGTGGGGGNSSTFGGGNGGAGCGGVCNMGTMTMTACTLSGNAGTGGAGGAGNSFINNGASGSRSGGLAANSGASTLRNTLCAGNTVNGGTVGDVSGVFNSAGHNLIGVGVAASGFVATGDQSGTSAVPLDAQLGPLQNNGGSTDTMSPLATSPALDKGRAFSLTTDQRGLRRLYNDPAIANGPGGDGTDAGAFELQTIIPVPPNFISIFRLGSTLHMVLRGEADRGYQLQHSDDLSASWANLGIPQTTDSIGVTEFIAGPLSARHFYRAVQIP